MHSKSQREVGPGGGEAGKCIESRGAIARSRSITSTRIMIRPQSVRALGLKVCSTPAPSAVECPLAELHSSEDRINNAHTTINIPCRRYLWLNAHALRNVSGSSNDRGTRATVSAKLMTRSTSPVKRTKRLERRFPFRVDVGRISWRITRQPSFDKSVIKVITGRKYGRRFFNVTRERQN